VAILEKVKSTIRGASSATARRVESFRDGRRRRELLIELGELTYREHADDDVDSTLVAPILTELDEMATGTIDDDTSDVSAAE